VKEKEKEKEKEKKGTCRYLAKLARFDLVPDDGESNPSM